MMIGQTTISGRKVIYEFARVTSLEGWWWWTLLVASLGALVFVSIRYYRRDVSELSRPIQIALVALRVVTILALVFFFFNLQRRTQRMVTRPSEVAVLVDTSQSMSLPADTGSGAISRIDRARQLFDASPLLERLSAEHQTSIYTFGQQAEPRLIESRGEMVDQSEAAEPSEQAPGGSLIAVAGTLLILVGCLLGLTALLIGFAARGLAPGWWVVGCVAALVPGIGLLGAVYSVRTQQSLGQLLGIDPAAAAAGQPVADPEVSGQPPPRRVMNWSDAIAASAPQSRIGDAIRTVLTTHDPATLAGLVLVTDGQNNGGTDLTAAVAAASRAEVSLYPIGVGSSAAPINVRVVDLDAPRRVYPGDNFVVSAVLQGSGPSPLDVEVQLLDGLDKPGSAEAGRDQGSPPPGEVVDSQRVQVSNDGTLTGIRFELEPESVGRRRLAVRIVAPPEDKNTLDDLRDARYEVVSRKLRVLAIAGGPTREYRFVRNLLHRDKSIELHAWLQTGQPGISQDADELLTRFPASAEQLFGYDSIVMFDPDWEVFSGEDLDLLDRWLTQQAGGLILVAGPVYHPQWTRKRTDPRVAKIAGFFPINISTRSSLAATGRQGGETAWPLSLTSEARRAEFLWVADSAADSFGVWDKFDGVYDYVDAKSAKPGAKVYAHFSDPTTQIGGSLPIYLASHFYGAGRVYFQGSGEMWRLRDKSDAYFDSYYTKLIRWVAEGRLLRDSNRGLLLVDSSRAQVGDTITVRAVLTDEQFEPLDVPQVQAKLLAPGGRIEDLTLLPQPGEPRGGTYGLRFVVREAGSYEIRVTLGDALNEQILRQTVQVRLPTIELERPKRNDRDLQAAAEHTNGVYLPLEQATTDESVVANLAKWLRPQPQTTVLPGTPDIDFARRRNGVLMWLIVVVLTMEWVIRRLHRLA